MSRLYDACAAETDPYPKVYQGAASGAYFVQQLKWPYKPELIGWNLSEVEELRDRLTVFLEGAWAEK